MLILTYFFSVFKLWTNKSYFNGLLYIYIDKEELQFRFSSEAIFQTLFYLFIFFFWFNSKIWLMIDIDNLS